MNSMKIPEPIRLWWHDGAGVRVLRYSGRQWTVLAVVSFICTTVALLLGNGVIGRAVQLVVPAMLIPAGIAALVGAITAAILTRRFRRAHQL